MAQDSFKQPKIDPLLLKNRSKLAQTWTQGAPRSQPYKALQGLIRLIRLKLPKIYNIWGFFEIVRISKRIFDGITAHLRKTSAPTCAATLFMEKYATYSLIHIFPFSFFRDVPGAAWRNFIEAGEKGGKSWKGRRTLKKSEYGGKN